MVHVEKGYSNNTIVLLVNILLTLFIDLTHTKSVNLTVGGVFSAVVSVVLHYNRVR